MPPFEVTPESLTDAARMLWSVAGTVTHAAGHVRSAGAGVQGAAGSADADAAFAGLVSAWSGALGRMGESLTGFERNTEVAAELYQHADATAMPSAPPPPPPPAKNQQPVDPRFLA
jgi:uncharacterized protein YukE